MKAFLQKVWAWIVGHKVIAIAVAAVVVVGSTCAIVLPTALHKHTYSTEWATDDTNHWHNASCKHTEEKSDLGAHEAAAAYSSDEINHWKDCTTCGYDLEVAAHVYDQKVANPEYLKDAATASTKAVYYHSCICGKAGTTTFETDKEVATITNIVISGKTYDGTAIASPTYEKSSDGAVIVEYSVKDANAFTATAPIDAGEYTVRVTVAETETHTGAVATEDFTIAKATINIGDIDVELANKTYDGNPINEPMYVVDSFVANADKVVEYKVKGTDDSAYTTTAPTDAGEYTVRVKISDSTNYNGATKTADFTITPKVIDINEFYSFTYEATDYYFEEIPATELVERDQDLELWFDFYFAGIDAGSALESIEISNDANQVNTNYAVGDQIGAEIIKKGLAGSSAHLNVYYGDLIEDTETAGVYYFDYVMTSEDDYGVYPDDEVTIRFYYSDVNAGTDAERFEIIDSNNYYDAGMGFNNTQVSAKVLEFPELIISQCNGLGIVAYEFPENELGEVVIVMFTAKNGANVVDCSGRYWGISAEDFAFFVNNNEETENYCFDIPYGEDDYLNLFFIGEPISFTNDVKGQSSNSISMEDFPTGGLFPLEVTGGKYEVKFSDNFGEVSGLYNENGDEVDINSNLACGTYYLWITTPSTPTIYDTFRVDKTANEIKSLETLNIKAGRYDAVNGVVVTLTEADGIYAGDEVTITIDVSYIDEADWTTGEVFGLTDNLADSGNGVLVATLGGADKDYYMINWPGVTVTVCFEPDMRGICTACGEYLGITEYSVNEWIMELDIAAGETIYLRVELDTEGNPMYNFKFQASSGSNYLIMPGNLNINVYLDSTSAAGDTPIAMDLTAKAFDTSEYMYIVITATSHGIYNIQIEETF